MIQIKLIYGETTIQDTLGFGTAIIGDIGLRISNEWDYLADSAGSDVSQAGESPLTNDGTWSPI